MRIGPSLFARTLSCQDLRAEMRFRWVSRLAGFLNTATDEFTVELTNIGVRQAFGGQGFGSFY